MPKSSQQQIYEDELKVIGELQRNANQSIDKIAKTCKFSRQKVWRIIKRLENSKLIWGYYTVIDDEAYDKKTFIMLIKRSFKPMKDAADKIIHLTMHKIGREIGVDVIYSSYLHGYYDWMFILTGKNIQEIKKFDSLLTNEYQDLIKETMILEEIFPIKKHGVVNPNVEKLKDFF
jgi:DNA-binding Lrp family transcriptional regulator